MLSFSPQSSCTGRLSPAGFLHPLVSVYQAAAGRSAKNQPLTLAQHPERALSSHTTHTWMTRDMYCKFHMVQETDKDIQFLN